MSKIIAVVSGGLDSVTMAYHLKAEGHQLHLLAVDYGQRHRKELEFARIAADRLDAPFEVADLSAARNILRGSSLTDTAVDVPSDKGPAQGSPNIVPNRNALILSAAFALAVVEQAEAVSFGIMADDIGPADTSLEFLAAFLAMERVATRGYARPDLDLLSPLAHLHKDGVIALGDSLHVPWDETWTCFRGEEVHCGRCSACWERREGFTKAGVKDPTVYGER
ncbi:exsB protein [Streptomyces sp. 150FB]|uniref:7-cyano-7-deazaguanine synthase n=1 Tax=Streptomyces sp. 150FB TaxID=1576605 RepID=UPI0005894895|nr:7-cyano-7-deazaguanine synthase [Streptomyces sp. 150FB]KIF74273.1 exsB protein [Streptomyces sp. 150FB]